MWDPNTLYDYGRIRQQDLIERGQQSASTRGAQSRRQRVWIAWREHHRLGDRLRPLKSFLSRFPRWIMTTSIRNLRLLSQAREATLNGATRIRRGFR